jgi:hypothetical protein
MPLHPAYAFVRKVALPHVVHLRAAGAPCLTVHIRYDSWVSEVCLGAFGPHFAGCPALLPSPLHKCRFLV